MPLRKLPGGASPQVARCFKEEALMNRFVTCLAIAALAVQMDPGPARRCPTRKRPPLRSAILDCRAGA